MFGNRKDYLLEEMMTAVNQIELNLLLEAIFQKYGYDFRDYSKSSIKRRIFMRQGLSKIPSLSDMQHRLLHDRSFFNTLLSDLSVNVTEMFRDPFFYKAIRESVIPILRTYPFFKIWHAGCSTGEEVYSMAILLKEEGLLDRALIYATDFNETVLIKARDGIYPLDRMDEFSTNYQHASGKKSLANYYSTTYGAAVMDPSLKKHILFAQHNLATDNVFCEMHLIMCRNVLIYFNKELQDRAIGLFGNSLIRKGILCLGSKESLKFTQYADNFDELVAQEKIYQKSI